ncbi:hypothetical protein F4805DRAFT_413546 [Annulohypoxylon moriforme]|nr:hypothetical protein F4805DRAFT_413546 [Annulohypoxylon moriforme]
MSVRQTQAEPTSDVELSPRSPYDSPSDGYDFSSDVDGPLSDGSLPSFEDGPPVYPEDGPSKPNPKPPYWSLFESEDEQQRPWNSNQKDKNKDKQILPRDYSIIENDTSRHGPPSAISKKSIEETSTRPAQPTSTPREVLSKRKVNGIWDSCHAADLTVHLVLSAQEDLDETLEEFGRLQRLGHFASARQFFAENLREHIEKPQVLIGYAEMLLEQGDYNALCEIGDVTMHRACDSLVDSDDHLLLTIYWKLIKVLSVHYKPDGPDVFLTKHDVVNGAIEDFQALINANERPITSTEIKILALFYRLCDFIDNPTMPERLQKEFSPDFLEGLYRDLLKEGRIWDLRDIAVANVSILCWNGIDFVSDWSRMIIDTSTTLALLDILVSLMFYESEYSTKTDDNIETFLRQSEPLALWIMENDPDNMRSRPFLRWMLVKAQYADAKGPHYAHSYGEQLQSWPGLVFHSRRLQLPQYIPVHGENPGWEIEDAASKFERPVRLAMKISRELGDYQTEVLALQRLIVLSANPINEFEELCNLQSLTQGDFCGYSKTLASKYLISNTEDLRKDLKQKISRLFNIPYFSNCVSMLDSWILNMLQCSLEGEGPTAQRALEDADEDYQDLPTAFREEIDKKFPAIPQRVERTKNPLSPSKLKLRFKRNGGPDTREKTEGAGSREKEQHLMTGRDDGLRWWKEGESITLSNDRPTFKTWGPKPFKGQRINESHDKGQPLQMAETSTQRQKTEETPMEPSQDPRGQQPNPKISDKQIPPNRRNPNTAGSTSGLKERLGRREPVNYYEDAESSHSPAHVANNEKLEVKGEVYKEHDTATVDRSENKDLKSQDSNRTIDVGQLDKGGKEFHIQDSGIDVNIGQTGETRTPRGKDPQRPKEKSTLPKGEHKTNPAVATVESTEDLGENAGDVAYTSKDDIDIDRKRSFF